MTYITEQQLRERFSLARRQSNTRFFSATHVLNEGRITDSSAKYDIFLSHSSEDNEIIAGLKLLFEDFHFSVYVDWNDPELNPQYVTPQTAETLRNRMANCKCLIYAYSENARGSKWMPWELGYFDGLKQSMVAVLPISKVSSKSIEGSEYVGLYNVIDIDTIQGSTDKTLWVNNGTEYVKMSGWLQGTKPYKH